jgi:hypothetical protein
VARTAHSDEGWPVSFYTVVWTAIIVGFVMTLLVLALR